MKAPAYITRHINFNSDDYAYLTGKGWTNKEVKARWDEESAQGKGACGWNANWAQKKLSSVTAR